MQPETIAKLLDLNEQFYQTFAVQFSQTRQRLQPGVERLLPDLLAQERLLELGCGNGELAKTLAQRGFRGLYTGLDFSAEFLSIARQSLPEDFHSQFIRTSVYADDWQKKLPVNMYTTVVAFAVLHHLPGADGRRAVLKRVHSLLPAGGVFIHSNWQFLRSERLRQRIQPWSRVGLRESDLDPGDSLLDWRSGGMGLRYVHHFSENELSSLAAETGFKVIRTFISDGKTSDLSLYQVWEAEQDSGTDSSEAQSSKKAT